MGESPKKLVTWKQWVMVVPAIFVGVGFYLLQRYHEAGGIRTGDIVAAAVTVLVALGIATTIFWYANRPERGGKA
jgi:hypothetical protein